MPAAVKNDRIRIRSARSAIVNASAPGGALVWCDVDGEGAIVGQDGHRTEKWLRDALAKDLHVDDREYYAVELAAKMPAKRDGAQLSDGAWVWLKPVKKRLIELAEKILNGEAPVTGSD